MVIPAIPHYLEKHLKDKQAPPGHRFGPYFPVWKTDWTLDKNKKKEALEQVLTFEQTAVDLVKNVQTRQLDNADKLGKKVYRITARSSAPFVTGMGMEHPVENGFAFLTLYGLPYLAGSSIKGVLRKAAEELALSGDPADRKGWDILALWRLFGFEATSASLGVMGKLPNIKLLSDMATEKEKAYFAVIRELPLDDVREIMEAVLPSEKRKPYREDPYTFLAALVMDRKLRESLSFRGALSFWDVFPEPPQGKLGVEILNPHHTRYYQQEVPPADCESPIPNFFLVVQPGATFIFHIQCTTNQLPDQLTSSWRQLLQVAFDHVFDWLGFGAKTSVGYGQMKLDKNARKTPEKNNLAVAESCLAGPDKKGLVRHPWLEETLLRIAKQTHCSDEEALRGKLLAEYWQALEDSDVKQAVLEDIRSCWEERGWWNNPTGRAIKKAKTIYEGKRS